MVQYPPPGSFKPIEKTQHDQSTDAHAGKPKSVEDNKENDADKKDNDLIMNKRSEVLAMALGVEIKRGGNYFYYRHDLLV